MKIEKLDISGVNPGYKRIGAGGSFKIHTERGIFTICERANGDVQLSVNDILTVSPMASNSIKISGLK